MSIPENFAGNHFINIHRCTSQYCVRHSHSFLELGYVVSGEAQNNLNENESTIKKGNYFIIDYGASHNYHSIGEESLLVINCLFDPEFIDQSLRGCKSFSDVVNSYMIKHSYNTTNISPANYIFFDDDGEIYKLLQDMLDEFDAQNPGFIDIMRCKLIEIIIRTMRKRTVEQISSSNEICAYMMNFAQNNLAEKNILGRISQNLRISESCLSRKFKREIGLTFSSYVRKIRVEHACSLLANTNKEIIEISQLAGYSDSKFFNESFKRQLGITPRQFRRKARS